jgi:Tfp pilus assembly protein PilF
MNLGVSLMGQYNYDGAVKAFEQALRAEPELTEAKINLAIARFNRARKEDQDIDQSGELLDAVLKTDTNNVRALYFKGIVLQHLGQSEMAVSCFESVLQQRPDDGVAWYLLGMCKQRLGRNCEREMLKAIELRPYLGSAYYKLFQSLQAEGETGKARPYLEKFKQLRESPLNETIELPQYNQMGELALVLPPPARNTPPITPGAFALQPAGEPFATGEPLLYGVREPSTPASATTSQPLAFGGAALGDRRSDGSQDVLLTAPGQDGAGRLVLLRRNAQGVFAEATVGSGLESVHGALACAMGDFDNDGNTDLFAAGPGASRLLRNKGDGTFADVTAQSNLEVEDAASRAALFVDADHDGDLDLLVCGAGAGGLRLWNNNADGTFTNVAAKAGIACSNTPCLLVLPGDLDGDRDTDLVVLCEGRKARFFLNDLLAGYRETDAGGVEARGDLGGVLQDFNGDRQLDLLVLGGNPARLDL